jgi:alkylation response protein AidB-like acyl-CoA dehydrogenase
LSIGVETILQWFSDEAHAEIYSSEEEMIIAGSWNPPGQAVAVEGGYEVTGQWNITSGCHYASWFLINAMIMEKDQPKILDNGHPHLLNILVPASKVKLIETWNTIGMKGTGSHDIATENVFVPAHRTVNMLPIEKANGRGFQGPLYNNSVWYAIAGIAVPALGIARAAISDTLELIKNKIPNYTETKLKDLQTTQIKLAEAEATLRAARAYFYQNVKKSWERARSGERITMDTRISLQMAATFAIEACVKSVGIVHDIAGLTGMRESHPIERHFRDINTIKQHAFTSTARYQSVGQILLGLEPNWGFFHF